MTRGAAVRLALVPALLAPLVPAASGAQAAPLCDGRALRAAATHAWPFPLDRAVALPSASLTLRDALDEVARAASLRLSYSPERLPLARLACVAPGTVPVGDALIALLAGTDVVPVLAGGDQVVLAPDHAGASTATPDAARPARQLERVVVTGTATGGPERASPFALSVVEPSAASRAGAQTLSQLLDGQVPGVWLWTQSPTSALARWGSVRGASSFGASAPKVYVDGIEVANPLLVTQLDPARVGSVEVIRGPQGAALYGADAIGGVVNIVTRHEGAAGGSPAELRGSAGAARSDFVEGGVLAQEYGLVLRGGAAARSASFGATAQTLGAFVPGAGTRQVTAGGSARWVGARAVVTGTTRLFAQRADAPASPLLRAAPGLATASDTVPGRQATTQYTIGGNATFHGSEKWTHVLIAGVDGYALEGATTTALPIVSSSDSALRAATGRADRLSVRASATRRGGDESRAYTLTLGAEHSTGREHTNGAAGIAFRSWGGDSIVAAGPRTAWRNATGVLAQGALALRDQLFLTGGARLERIAGGSALAQATLLPTLGAAWVGERGDAMLKLRAAYGRAIRPAPSAMPMGGPGRDAIAALPPEEQSGIEMGADLLLGRRLGLHATRFDQRASGLVQPVVFVDSLRRRGSSGPGGPGGQPRQYERRLAYLLQTVGAIDNTGWELAATATEGPLALAGTLTLVESRVARVARGYTGDLRRGDRMLEVPARTLGASAAWNARRWNASLGLARAADWINYDRLRLAADVGAATAEGAEGALPAGDDLRAYWRRYEGVTRLHATLALPLWRGTTLTARGDNLLDRQTGEPDNLTVLPGRMVGVGFRTRF